MHYKNQKVKKLLIIGASSFFSRNFIRENFEDYEIHGTYFKNKIEEVKSKKIDVTNFKELYKFIKKLKPTVIINAASLTSVEECEKNYDKAYNINTLVASDLAKICKKESITFVHLSTDHLFDGKDSFYREIDTPKPINNYGITKFLSEKKIFKINKSALIIRTNFFGLGHGFSYKFFDNIFESLKKKKKFIYLRIFFIPQSP